MSFLLIGDPHFKKGNKDETEPFVKSTLAYLEQDQEIEKIIVLGDVLDTHEKINMFAMIRATDFLISLTQYAPVYVIIGNHDRADNSVFLTPYHSLYPLKFCEYDITIVDQVLVEDDIVYVPYVEPGKFMEALATKKIDKEKLKSGQIRYIFAHQEFKGADMGGIFSAMGDEWSSKYPTIYSGHIHLNQKLRGVNYIGTPYQTGFSDDTNKGIYLLKDEELTKIELDIIIKCIINLKIEELLEYEFPKNRKIKLIIEGDATEIRKIIQTSEYKRKLKDIKYVIKDIPSYNLPEVKEGKKRVFSISNIFKIVRDDCRDETEKEIMDEIISMSDTN